MFEKAASFNQYLSMWSTSSATDMSSMFKKAYAFDGELSGWKTGSVVTMESMFEDGTHFFPLHYVVQE